MISGVNMGEPQVCNGFQVCMSCACNRLTCKKLGQRTFEGPDQSGWGPLEPLIVHPTWSTCCKDVDYFPLWTFRTDPDSVCMYCHVLSCIVMYCLRLKSSTSSLAFAYPAGPLCKTSEAPYCTSFLWNVNPFKKREITPRETFDSGPAKQIGEFFKMSQIRLTSNISGCPTLIYPIWGCYTFSL